MGELITHFGIDGRLLLAQAVNFFVLLAVLWKFAYRPILEVFRARRETIARGLADARSAGEHLAKVEKIGEERLVSARAEALGIISQAEATGRQRKEEALADAARKGEAVLADARRAAGEERARAQETLYAGAEDLVREGIARVLGHLPPEARDGDLIRRAVSELRAAGAHKIKA
jgi:F-type H+-transporting ATPase subunit b